MPLSKARNRERMRQLRLHASENTGFVQPIASEEKIEIVQPIVQPIASAKVVQPIASVVQPVQLKKHFGYIEHHGQRLKVELDDDGNPIPGD